MADHRGTQKFASFQLTALSLGCPQSLPWASLVAQLVKSLPTMQETLVRLLGQEDPPGKGMATHSSILAWRIPWMEQPGRLQSTGLQGVRHHCTTNHSPEPITAQALERQATSSLGMSSVKGSPDDVKTQTRKGTTKRVVAVARGD